MTIAPLRPFVTELRYRRAILDVGECTTVEGQLKHHARGHWSLQWLCPDTNRWRVKHFSNEKDARSYIQFRSSHWWLPSNTNPLDGVNDAHNLTTRHQWNITKQSDAGPYVGRYVQIGYWHGA
jgi:hypothetical protein